MSDKLRVAVAGLGVGRSHVAAYSALPEHFEVVAVCDIDQDKARAVADLAKVGRVAADLTDLCRMDDVDIIDLATPPWLHFEQTRQVLSAGKHCICEKPLVGSLREVDDLIAAEKESGKRMMPIFQYRFGNGVRKLKLLVEQGIAGRAYLTSIDLAWRRRPDYYAIPWRTNWRMGLGGTLVNHGIHALDMTMDVLGPVHSVFTRMKTLVNPIAVEDTAGVVLEMADGSLATLAETLGSNVQITRHRFCFSNLVAESNTTPYDNSHEPWTFTGDTPELQQRIDAALAAFTPQPERFIGQFLGFAQALRADALPPVPLADARRAVELVTAMYRSAHSGQPVTLPLPKDEWYNGWGQFFM
jgi:predicted dehydrogenase